MEVKIYIPHPLLQEFVLNISTINAVLPPGVEEVVTPYPPTPFQSLLFYCKDPIWMGQNDKQNFEKQPLTVLTGPQFTRINVKVRRQLKAIRVDFLPGGIHRLLAIPMHELFDKGFDAEEVFGNEMKYLDEQLQQITQLEAGKKMVEKFLLNQVSKLKEILPFDAALKMLLENSGCMSIEQTASFACLSLKQFERKCNERIGMNPKTYARILRFSKAYRLHEALPGLSWTKIAYEAGYYDQMHMIKDFKTFAGVNPTVIEQQLLATPLRMQKDLKF